MELPAQRIVEGGSAPPISVNTAPSNASPLALIARTSAHDPADRRFHAQPIACPACGPRLHIRVEEIVARLRAGEIVAIKGLGGFHLACDAANPGTVARLRALKQRNGKPFAMMVASLAEARRIAETSPAEAALLAGPERPVVLVAHGGLIAALTGAVLGLPVDNWPVLGGMGNASWVQLSGHSARDADFGDVRWRLDVWNASAQVANDVL